MQDDTLIVEDLMLLMLDDESGTIAGEGTLFYTLGGAVLVELAMLGRVDTDGGRPGLAGHKIVTTGDGPIEDPMLRAAYEKVAEKTRGVQTLLITIGTDLRGQVLDRLVDRGLVRPEKRKVLGLFTSTRLMPAEDTTHETELRERVRAALEDGATPDPHTAAVIALLSASGTLPSLHPTPKWSSKVYTRAKELEAGHWGSDAVNDAVARTTASIAASAAAVAVTTVTST